MQEIPAVLQLFAVELSTELEMFYGSSLLGRNCNWTSDFVVDPLLCAERCTNGGSDEQQWPFLPDLLESSISHHLAIDVT